MEFRLADTFTESLARLTGEEQKAAKTTVLDLQLDPKGNGLQVHRLDKARDRNFWSVRVSRDLRLIVHRTDASVLVCYVGHHDKAYAWAERRKIEVHPKTGAAQLVEIRETVREIVVPAYVPAPETPAPAARPAPGPAPAAPVAVGRKVPPPALPPLAAISPEDLLAYGVPSDWVDDLRAATADQLWELAGHLPAEAREAVLDLATGGRPPKPEPVGPTVGPFDHPDAQRRFRTMTNVDELRAALEAPWDKWAVFLHPEQRAWVERDFAGPARVAGSAGTGKTVVALHRAAHLARVHPEARVLLTTFSHTLAHALRTQLRRLLASEPRLGERIDVHSLPSLALRLHRAHLGPVELASPDLVDRLLREALAAAPAGPAGSPPKPSMRFLRAEWEHVIDAWQIRSWEAYRDVKRLGRQTRLSEAQRRVSWTLFEQVHAGLRQQGRLTEAGVFTALAEALSTKGKAGTVVFDHAVVDESQDLGVPHLRFFAALGGQRPNALFFAGDLGQRIFQHPFSWKSLGVDIRGRSRTLRVNYRTSHQIRMQADRLLQPSVADADGNEEVRRDTVSVFDGPPPLVRAYADAAAEAAAVAGWLSDCARSGIAPHETCLCVRSEAQVPRAEAALAQAGLPGVVLDDEVQGAPGRVAICTMHRAKGLEFRAVAVIACDDDVVPLQARMESIGDTGDLQDAYETERHLLYVACTRARDRLLVTAVEPASEFLADLQGRSSGGAPVA
ncbi:MAG: 3'-5' exonuclease [Planctomycetia bacterium]